ncbi:hypothetical protein ACFX14_022953 [Malus domestica]
MDMVTAHLYGDLDMEIYMKVPEGLTLTGANSSNTQNTLFIRLKCSLYRLKQAVQMCCNRLSEYLISVNNELCLFVSIKKSHSGFVIVSIYVDDMNLIWTLEELEKITVHLKSEF